MPFSECSVRMRFTRCNAAGTAPSPTGRAMRRAGAKASGNSTSARPMGDTTKAVVTAACVLLGGCAVMGESECRSADWYQLGYRDADPYGLRPKIDLYAHQCRAWVQASESE